MEFHESERALNNFTRTIIVVPVVKSMNPLRVIGERERDILFNCFPDETINRIIHCRDLIASTSRIRRGGAGCAGYVSPDTIAPMATQKITKRKRSKLTVKNGVIAGRKCNSEQTPAFGEASDCSKAEELPLSR